MNQQVVWIPSVVRKTQLCYNGHEDNFLAEQKTSANVFKSIPVWIPGVVWRANTIVLSPYQAEGWPQWLAGICVVAVHINIRTTAGSLKDKGIGQTSMATIPFCIGGMAYNTEIHDSIDTCSLTMASAWQVTVSQRTAAASISFGSKSLDMNSSLAHIGRVTNTFAQLAFHHVKYKIGWQEPWPLHVTGLLQALSVALLQVFPWFLASQGCID